MTMLSVRVDDEISGRIDAWCEKHEVARSEFVREALRREVNRRVSIDEAEWIGGVPDDDVVATEAFMAIQDWGPHEDWSAWHAWLDARDVAEADSGISPSRASRGDEDAAR